MDIEGGGFELVLEMKDYLMDQKPIFHLSTHILYLPGQGRKIKMEKLVDTLQFYTHCFDENQDAINLDESILNSILDRFRSFLFLP